MTNVYTSSIVSSGGDKVVIKTEVITIRCSKEEKELIVKGAEEENKSISSFIICAAYDRRIKKAMEVEDGD